MNKDVIYIDVDDDITSIVGRVKGSKQKIIALVPPKRIGVLQSAVNLRLLARAASQQGKRVVLITNNQALVALSAAAQIPVAKNLQTKPEIAEIAALDIDDGNDVIDGSELPVGDLDSAARKASTKAGPSIDGIDVSDIDEAKPAKKPGVAKKPRGDKKVSGKVPNFNTFRKKLFIGGAAAVLLIAFGVWAFVFAPAATIVITAKTTSVPVSSVAQLSGSTTDANKGLLKVASKSQKKAASVEFEGTGSKEVGERASGTVSIRNCDSNDSFTINASTVFTSRSGQRYISSSAVVVPGFRGSASACRNTGSGAGTATVNVTAEDIGDSYNIQSQSFSVAGVSGDVYATGSQMTGGSQKTVKIVTAEDVQKASEALVEQSSDAVKQELTAQFGSSYQVIADSFTIDRQTPASSPAIGEEVSGKAKLSSETTYVLSAIVRDDLQKYLKGVLSTQLTDKTRQKVYEDGAKKATVGQYQKDGDTATVRITANGMIGPTIDEEEVKDQSKGKRYGEIQQSLEAIEGVSDVDVKFSYFWVRTVPKNSDKITVEFKLQDAKD